VFTLVAELYIYANLIELNLIPDLYPRLPLMMSKHSKYVRQLLSMLHFDDLICQLMY
jgi:hypothetical protein